MSEFRTNVFSMATASNYFWSSVVGVVKVDYFDFPCEIFEILGELPATFRFLEFFCFFPIFSAQTCLFLNRK